VSSSTGRINSPAWTLRYYGRSAPGFVEGLHCMLGGGIDAPSGTAGLPGDRAEVDQPAFAPGAHRREHGAGHGQQPNCSLT